MRGLFAAVNFVILFVVLAIPYQKLSKAAYAESMERRALNAHPRYEIPAGRPVPSVMIHASEDKNGGWNVHLMTENFTFTPENSGQDDVAGEGHAHLFLNGKKVARVYGNWFHITLPKGKNKLKANLTTNSHKDYYSNGQAVEHEVELEEGREVSIQHVH